MSGKRTPSVAMRADDPANKRAYFRWPFKGTGFPCRMSKKTFEIRLKDLSSGGACGLMEEPVAVGDYIMIEFDERHIVEAQVTWVRRVLVGVRFSNTLNTDFIAKLHERASAQPEESGDDLYLIAPRPRTRTAPARG